MIWRDLTSVMKEIESIAKNRGGRKKKTLMIALIDEALVANKKRAMELFRMIKKRKFKNVEFGCYGRVNCMDEPLLKAMKEAGVTQVYYGIESGSNASLKAMRKGFTIEDAKRVFKITKKYILNIMASFMVCFPFESVEQAKETLAHGVFYGLLSFRERGTGERDPCRL